MPHQWTNLAARLSSLKQSERLRVIGILVLVLGITGACLFYWVEARSAAPTIDDLLPDDSRARAREIGILMGTFGVMMLGWADALARPGTQAIIIAAVSALVALGCFRAARVLDDNSQVRARQGNDG
jgi:uncharacterized protein YjeT (DUF2065 family)